MYSANCNLHPIASKTVFVQLLTAGSVQDVCDSNRYSSDRIPHKGAWDTQQATAEAVNGARPVPLRLPPWPAARHALSPSA